MALSAKHISKKIQSRTESLSDARDFVATAARRFGFSEEEAANITLAVDEACTNIIKHAYQFAPDKEIEIEIVEGKESFEIRMYDSGTKFDPAAIRPPDLKEHLGHFRRGGLGIYLMKKLMDKVDTNSSRANEMKSVL